MLAQLALLVCFQFVGEAVVASTGLTFPGPLCGMLLLLGFLVATGGPSGGLSTVATTLVEHLGLLFVPAGTAVVTYSALFARDGLPIVVALFISTTVAIHVSGTIAERLRTSDRAEPGDARA
jgi:holin-like protein